MKISLATILHSSSIQSPSCYISFMVGIKYSLFLKKVFPNDHKFRFKIPKAEADFIRPSALDMDFEMDRWNCWNALFRYLNIYPECQNMRINGWYSTTFSNIFSDWRYFYLTASKKWMTVQPTNILLLFWTFFCIVTL